MSAKKHKKNTNTTRPTYAFARWFVEKGPARVLRYFLIALLVGFVFVAIQTTMILSRDLTTTVTVATESLKFSLSDGAELSWILPAGSFLLPGDNNKLTCKNEREVAGVIVEWRCQYDYRSRMTIRGPGNVSLEITPEGKLSIAAHSITNESVEKSCMDANNNMTADSGFLVELRDEKDALIPVFETFSSFDKEFRYDTRLLEKDKYVKDENDEVETAGPPRMAKSLRFPIVAATGTVGSHIREASMISDEVSGFWQPSLLSGDVTSFALNRPSRGKYEIQHERLDAGDVLDIHTQPERQDESISDVEKSQCTQAQRPNQRPAKSIWGVATIGPQTVMMSGATEVTQPVIRAVLHTTHRDIFVTRLGSRREGHIIRAHRWTIISRWPNGQQIWVLLVSAILVFTFFLQLGDWIGHKGLKELKKEGKKHTERKRKSD